MRPNVRSPIIPLDFDKNVRAVRKELMIDYQNGDIYVVSPDDANLFICITNKIKNAILAIIQGGDTDITDISNCQITIEGIGTYLVSDFLKILWDNQIDAIPFPDIDSVALRAHYYDNLSIGTQNNKVSLIGFEGAPNNYVPIKRGGMLQWLPLSEAQQPESPTPGRSGVHIVEPYYDPDAKDNLFGRINLIEGAQIQRTIDLSTKAVVYMPTALTDYCHIKWLINTIAGESIYLTFDPNVTIIWAYVNDSYMGENMMAIYDFETFDGGLTWFGKRQTYGNTLESEDYVTRKELYNNFYTKPEVIDFISWSYDVDEDDLLPEGGNPSEDDIGELNGIIGKCDCVKLVPATDAQVDSLFWNIDFVDNPADDVELAKLIDIIKLFPDGTFTACDFCTIRLNTADAADIQQLVINYDSGDYAATGNPVTSACGCSVDTADSADIDNLLNNPGALDTSADNTIVYGDECLAETASTKDISDITNGGDK